MSWTDEEIDQLYKNGNEGVSFEYKNEYWKEMEAMLPEQKSKDLLWFLTSFLFLGIVASGVLLSGGELNEKNASQANENKNTPLIAMVNMEENAVFGFGTKQKLGPKSARKGINMKSWERYSHNHPIEFDFSVTEISVGEFMPLGCERMPAFTDFTLLGVGETNEGKTSKQFESVNDTKKEEGIDRLPLIELQLASSMERLGLMRNQSFRTPIGASFYLEGNVGLSQSLVTPTSGISNSYGGGLGITIQKGNFYIDLGGNVQVANYDDIVFHTEFKKYIGPTSYQYRVEQNYKQINTLEGVLSLGYSKGNHNFAIGIRPSYVIWSKVERKSFRNNTLEADKTLGGNMEALNRVGVRPTIGYSYSITPRWKVGVNFGMRLKPAFNEEFIIKENSKFPIDGQLYLRRSLLWR